eukprot:63073-Amphidinium_carterae.2
MVCKVECVSNCGWRIRQGVEGPQSLGHGRQFKGLKDAGYGTGYQTVSRLKRDAIAALIEEVGCRTFFDSTGELRHGGYAGGDVENTSAVSGAATSWSAGADEVDDELETTATKVDYERKLEILSTMRLPESYETVVKGKMQRVASGTRGEVVWGRVQEDLTDVALRSLTKKVHDDSIKKGFPSCINCPLV